MDACKLLNKNMAQVESILTGQFWYSFPMRRQELSDSDMRESKSVAASAHSTRSVPAESIANTASLTAADPGPLKSPVGTCSPSSGPAVDSVAPSQHGSLFRCIGRLCESMCSR
eukprot:gnl/TRDRNA2_/TRDRNA2_83603_c0_seq2.p2 gnl/TRDRNA2_/TRDRNA2_83603_c0~~gnl/TRDRNA2_/TRDRNA2_83603_c0_seq2.p2  ORF type:complete len:114 (+),score=11.38 gnl/TRDRNA2_/TRDRNA2_83603_c0_seq2:142-483(+)